jgi:hypothetical protein
MAQAGYSSRTIIHQHVFGVPRGLVGRLLEEIAYSW